MVTVSGRADCYGRCRFKLVVLTFSARSQIEIMIVDDGSAHGCVGTVEKRHEFGLVCLHCDHLPPDLGNTNALSIACSPGIL